MEILLKHLLSTFSQHGSLFIAFFMVGLTGSVTHCMSMCGPFVACHTMCQVRTQPVKQAFLLPYHLGRATCYGALGFLSALLSRQIANSPLWPWVSTVMLAIAGIIFLIASLPQCKHFLPSLSKKTPYIHGVLLGFMPCGLLYTALIMAAATAEPLTGMVAMWFFVVGTIPALVAISSGTHILTNQWRGFMQKAGRFMMIINGCSLLVMAEKIVR